MGINRISRNRCCGLFTNQIITNMYIVKLEAKHEQTMKPWRCVNGNED